MLLLVAFTNASLTGQPVLNNAQNSNDNDSQNNSLTNVDDSVPSEESNLEPLSQIRAQSGKEELPHLSVFTSEFKATTAFIDLQDRLKDKS